MGLGLCEHVDGALDMGLCEYVDGGTRHGAV